MQLYISKIHHNGHIVIHFWHNDPKIGEYLESKQYIGYSLQEAVEKAIADLGIDPADAEIIFDEPEFELVEK